MATSHLSLERWINGEAARFADVLDAIIQRHGAGQSARLVAAMRHGVLAGGKRLRPFLVLESARVCGIDSSGARLVAAALEFVHCYSLIHDDLPAMDDDDVRRGQPTVHRAFDEATAILSGDGLLTMAFSVLASPESGFSPAVRCRLVAALAQAAGLAGMVGGQMLDLEAEGRFGAALAPDRAHIERLQGLKTGALLGFAAQSGALMSSRARAGDRAALGRFGTALGLAFQIRDDLIDEEGDAALAGKATGKDRGLGKATFVSLLGVEGARRRLEDSTRSGLAALARFGDRAAGLAAVLEFNRTRQA